MLVKHPTRHKTLAQVWNIKHILQSELFPRSPLQDHITFSLDISCSSITHVQLFTSHFFKRIKEGPIWAYMAGCSSINPPPFWLVTHQIYLLRHGSEV
ncbi:hypothetical protein Hanom_Chr00s053671g01781331 [Helianthus anomalus]